MLRNIIRYTYALQCLHDVLSEFTIIFHMSPSSLIKIHGSNLSSVNLVTKHKDRIDKIFPYWDIIFGNESEALAFAKASGWNVNITFFFFLLFFIFFLTNRSVFLDHGYI